MSNSVVSPTLEPDEVGLEARDQALLAEDQRHPVGRAALERLAVAVPDERDDRVVAVLARRGPRPAAERRVLVAQLLDDLVDPGVVDGLDLGPEVEVLVVAELDLRADRTVALKTSGLPSSAWTISTSAFASGRMSSLDERLAVGVLDQVLDGLVEDDARAERSLEDGARRLAGPEARHAGAAREPADGIADRAVEAIRGKLDLELDGRLGGRGPGDLHRPRSIGLVL